ncbi:hypothetical protein [Streptomyces sp. NPDC008137]|uniref:hypothetical protein n=1 Tax=Streptomyces sp. NPDC008137 TaxID=3364813 RepID=UPI0036E9F59C
MSQTAEDCIGAPLNASAETTGTPVLDALESFYARDIDDLASWAGRTLNDAVSRGRDVASTMAALRADEFMTVYLNQIHSVPPERWARALPLPDGHLRAALLGRELVDVPRSGRPNLFMDGRLYGAERLPEQLSPDCRELKAPLCYAHDIVFEDPFDDEHHALEQLRVLREYEPDTAGYPAFDPRIFVRTLETLSQLTPLIRSGTIIFIPRQLTAHPTSIATAGSSFAGAGGEVSRRELAERTLRAWLLTGGRAVPLFASTAEEAVFREVAGVLGGLLPEAEGTFMRRLANLALPSSGQLDTRRMLEIRHEEVFTRFRIRQRAALAAVGDGHDVSARQLYREEMRAAADEVNRRSNRSVLAKFTVPKAIGWLTGAMLVVPDGWQALFAAVGALTAESAVEAWQDRDQRAQQALHHHYATLSGPPPD